jgi:hypothetical protein
MPPSPLSISQADKQPPVPQVQSRPAIPEANQPGQAAVPPGVEVDGYERISTPLPQVSPRNPLLMTTSIPSTKTPRLVIDRLTVEVLPGPPLPALLQTTVRVIRPAASTGGKRGRESKLRFGLGQL